MFLLSNLGSVFAVFAGITILLSLPGESEALKCYGCETPDNCTVEQICPDEGYYCNKMVSRLGDKYTVQYDKRCSSLPVGRKEGCIEEKYKNVDTQLISCYCKTDFCNGGSITGISPAAVWFVCVLTIIRHFFVCNSG